jgi:hypothetical protein
MSNFEFLNRHRCVGVNTRTNVPIVGTNQPIDQILWSTEFGGLFQFAIPGEARLIHTVAATGMGWQHVSVSFGPQNFKTPSWEVMSFVKELFWEPEDCVIQLHPPKSRCVNYHEGCLHLWRCIDGREQPLPPTILVGIPGETKKNEKLVSSKTSG